MIIEGPGMDLLILKISKNSRLVIHPWTTTICCWSSERITFPPPNAINESEERITARSTRDELISGHLRKLYPFAAGISKSQQG
jgi:hypothetical protein